MGRFDEAAKQCEQAPEDAAFRKECLDRARLGQGRTAQAIRIPAISPTSNLGYLAIVYSRAGRRAEAEKLMAEAPALYPDRRGPFQFALAFAGLGDRDRTVEPLEQLARVGLVRMGLNSPEFAFLRGAPPSRLFAIGSDCRNRPDGCISDARPNAPNLGGSLRMHSRIA